VGDCETVGGWEMKKKTLKTIENTIAEMLVKIQLAINEGQNNTARLLCRSVRDLYSIIDAESGRQKYEFFTTLQRKESRKKK
jgi:hypothetical protein